MGKPQVAIYAFLPALVINFIANLYLIPRFGGIGAAWATNISYGIGSVAFIVVYSRLIKMPLGEILKLRKSDFYFLRDVKKLIQKRRDPR
jgi:O-antigen/teichoic acid export membrane protein